MVSQGAERFDVFVVTPPAPGDHVMVEMGEAALECPDPGGEFVPLGRGVGGGDLRPVRRGGQVSQIAGIVGVSEHLAQLVEG